MILLPNKVVIYLVGWMQEGRKSIFFWFRFLRETDFVLKSLALMLFTVLRCLISWCKLYLDTQGLC